MLPPPHAQRRVASLEAHNCGCERSHNTSTTPSSTTEAIGQRSGFNGATQALVMDTSPPTTTYVRESYQAIRSHDGPERCRVSPMLAGSSIEQSRQQQRWRPDYHIVYAAQLSSTHRAAGRTTYSDRNKQMPAYGRAYPTQSHGSQSGWCPTTTILRRCHKSCAASESAACRGTGTSSPTHNCSCERERSASTTAIAGR